MQIVANSYMLNKFRELKSFEMDLGNSLIPIKEKEVRLLDNFIFKYINMTKKQILSFGSIGSLKFYQDFSLKSENFLIFNDDSTYSVDYDDEEIEGFLTGVVREIKEKEGIKNSKIDGYQLKSINPDLKLPDDKYLEEMIKKRNS